MRKKEYWIPLCASLVSMGLLYTIGNIFEIPFLSWTLYKENPSEGIVFEAGGSLVPVFIGVVLGFITERIMKRKQKDNSNIE
ncbi:ATPase [Terribacillus saccharophilus]|uniref:ATPase n=1 Tax=Terribacillus saccharophilus TaxID=361277 RepID=UPI002DC104DB|nr:ATPase [Terribacillus saccharophilus]